MNATRTVVTTEVGIVGGGPAGLMLSHLLAKAGIDNIVVEKRDHETIRTTHRAGILEHGSVSLLTESGVDTRVLNEGHRHDGIDLRFGGESHRIDFRDLVGESVWLYPQNEVFVDLAASRERDGGDVRYSACDTEVLDITTDTPKIRFTESDGTPVEIRCRILVGADGSQSICRKAIPGDVRTDHFIEYPFAWFGILTEAPPSAPELIYARSDHGFALISQRNESVQRMYFQCDPSEDASTWSEERIWDELQKRVDGPDGFELKRGPIFEQMVLPFRSYVCEPMRHGNLFLAGDAGHTVPPTGAKGLNLALADVRVLFRALDSFFSTGSSDLLDAYSDTALERVWKAQNFSYWMTSMLHTREDATLFENKRALGELAAVVGSRYGQQYLAEAYTGWPDR
ncbi:p-hydroxybenzoate 3-monooxygenase [Rhodococcus rhodochrous J3]|jgi:p-hydroxybenzoate 3-monooxygenase|uniref:4-hydroxybenzoate 3-monooxygenase n=2 Tax=Rhodococcus rhodochrous TaxID=1829 RepID=A0AA47AA98_RHORH|nr:4-hydroxybenzoate 3-monooxygenase [Rhodococcus rhodochrous]AYA27688.1 4-hydroxybenzoate 3-monooxygenase [Rhodococcus rhodochrous]MBF4480418.1 4-hydroxybenzoate 3-monooxygenase [Rhodococcus rhodochrous]MCB8911580.1 4-hydroxybenzoate 3-monooxygenase [Rhodococcus rhodochrous]MCD2099694.1 4-hydroxybenzoate 3-monooxygenase [Rhodococcus rhodochrous]MCD2124174.1 4-hydroxybenzoate 3-monooxygenase [Rhodococcus rhodochrous]